MNVFNLSSLQIKYIINLISLLHYYETTVFQMKRLFDKSWDLSGLINAIVKKWTKSIFIETEYEILRQDLIKWFNKKQHF